MSLLRIYLLSYQELHIQPISHFGQDLCPVSCMAHGDKEVNVEHLKSIMPYTLAHRLQWRDEYASQKESHARRDSSPIHVAKETVNEIFRRYNEQSNQIKSALAAAYHNLSGHKTESVHGDHPIYEEIKRDIEAGLSAARLLSGFRDFPYQKKEIPLDRMVQPKGRVMDQIIAGYAKCEAMEIQDLVCEVEKGEIIEAYALAEKTLRSFDYDVDDIEEFIFELYKATGKDSPGYLRRHWDLSLCSLQ